MNGLLNPQQTFASFVVGAGNRLAVTAARAVAESPGTSYNPLFIYARPGLGKTHLLMAIGNSTAARGGRRVEYETLDQFVEAFQAAIAQGRADAYRQHYLEIDLLLIDDVQFLAGRREAQAELLRLIDTLQRANRQIVLASDRPPAEIQALDERLVTRFAGGLVIDMSAPDYETRVAILRRRAEDRGVAFAAGVLEAVAELPLDNVRELLGALNRLVAYQAVSEQPLDPVRAKELAGGPVLTSAAAPAAGSAGGTAGDEFGDFLTEISTTLAQQVDAWRENIARAIFRYEREGYRTTRLEVLLGEDLRDDPEAAIMAFEADVSALKALEAEAVALAPELAGAPAFRDPDTLAAAEALLAQVREGAEPPPAPLALWHLADFIEAPGNRMAVRAATGMLDEPGTRYNPFVIVGGAGTGKTHLLHGIGNALAERVGMVACVGAEEFTSGLIEALGREGLPQWRARYRRANALLIDDIQLLAGKEASQDELYLLFNAFLERGRQLVFTSTLPPGALTGLEPRIRTRLEAGLVVELPLPDRAFRLGVVERLLVDRTGKADPELATYLAAQPADSVRAVIALVDRVASFAESQRRPMTAALAKDLLEGPPTLRRAAAVRMSGVMPATPSGGRTPEKMVLEWPDIADLLIEDWR